MDVGVYLREEKMTVCGLLKGLHESSSLISDDGGLGRRVRNGQRGDLVLNTTGV